MKLKTITKIKISLTIMFAEMLGFVQKAKKETALTPDKPEAASKASAAEYFDDSFITTKVKATVFNEATLKSAEINVEIYKGVIQLSGFVNSQAEISNVAA